IRPLPGDMALFRHRQTGKNGHAAIVVAVSGTRILIIDGNNNDQVTPAPHWFDWSQNASAPKPLVGFASPV
ncbi:MAG: hypothetical protein JWM93_43, partial [Frankiales bacterium]|nr:hypothetical protein [Frankiales bacterium]